MKFIYNLWDKCFATILLQTFLHCRINGAMVQQSVTKYYAFSTSADLVDVDNLRSSRSTIKLVLQCKATEVRRFMNVSCFNLALNLHMYGISLQKSRKTVFHIG